MRTALLVAEGRWRRPGFLTEGSAIGQFGLQFWIIELNQTRIEEGGGQRDGTEPLLTPDPGKTHSYSSFSGTAFTAPSGH